MKGASGESKGSRRYDKENLLWQFTVAIRSDPVGSRENKYVKSVTLNGQPVTDWKIRHADVMRGGELVFEMEAL